MSKERLLIPNTLLAAAIFLAACTNPRDNPRPTAVATSDRSILTVTAQPYFRSFKESIDRLDQELAQDPNKINLLGPEILDISTKVFSQEIQGAVGINPQKYNPSELRKNLILESKKSFSDFVTTGNDCQGVNPDNLSFFIPSLANDDHINYDFIILQDQQTKKIRQHPGYLLVALALEGLHRTTPPTVPFRDSSQTLYIQRGLTLLTADTSRSLPGRSCLSGLFAQANSAIIYSSVTKMAYDLGISVLDLDLDPATAERTLKVLSILRPIFPNNFEPLRMQQNSETLNFLATIGRSIKAQNRNLSAPDINVGIDYLERMLP